MWNIEKYILALALLVFCALPSICSAEATYRVTETQLSELENQLNALQQNSVKLLELLNESEADLTVAQNQLKESANEIEKLQMQLTALKAESELAKQSLETANQELQQALESVQVLESRRKRTERQRDFWEVLAGVLAVVAAAK